MTYITPAHPARELAEAEALYASLRARLTALREELEDLGKRISAGEEINATVTGKTLFQIGETIGRCHKAELIVHECRKKQAGIARGDFAFDLDRARADIGCKLDRLRCTIGSGEVPG